jgi:hypothetical protein
MAVTGCVTVCSWLSVLPSSAGASVPPWMSRAVAVDATSDGKLRSPNTDTDTDTDTDTVTVTVTVTDTTERAETRAWTESTRDLHQSPVFASI